MTCIVGYINEKDKSVWIGGDSAGVDVYGYGIAVRKDAKVWVKDGMVLGMCGSFRMGQLLRYKLEAPAHPKGMDAFEYLVVEYIEAARKCLKDGGYTRVHQNEETGGTFMVGYQGRLFTVYDDFQVAENLTTPAAIGCGENYALGALYVYDQLRPNALPRKKIEAALEAAEENSAGVTGPFIIERLPYVDSK